MKRSWALGAMVSSVVALSACTALLGSYEVGAGGGAPGDETGTGGDGGTTTDGATPGADGAADAPIVCNAPEVACGPVCANLQTSVDHCGKCDRSCGGGTCTAGKCSTTMVVDLVGSKVTSMDVGANDVVFSFDDKLASCPKDGCKGAAPRQLGQTQYGFNNVVVLNNGTVVFESAPVQSTQRPAIYGCPLSGCPGVLTAWASDGLNGFEPRLRASGGDVFANGGGIGLVWTSCTAGTCTSPAKNFGPLKGTQTMTPTLTAVYFAYGGNISRCLKTETTCTPTVIVPGESPESMVADGGSLYWIRKGRDGFNEGKLMQCVLSTDCTVAANVKTIANGLDSPAELAVDASGAYWLTAGSRLQRCLPGNCPGGAQDFVPGALDTPHHLVATPNFLYWVEVTKIFRVAK